MVRGYMIVVVLVSAGCSHRPVVRPGTRPSPVHIGEAARPARPPVTLARFVEAVESLSRADDDRSHEYIVAVLERLADVLVDVPGVGQRRIERIRTLASELAESPLDSSSHANLVARALGEALAALAVVVPDEDAALQQKYFDAKTAASKVDPAAPLRSQTAPAAAAFEAIAETTMALLHANRESLPSTTPVIERDPVLFSQRAEAVAAATTALATSRTSSDIQRAAADVLESYATALSVLPTSTMSLEDQAASVWAIRLQADRLRGADALSFRRIGWMKHGLSVAVAALESLREREDPARVLATDARSAVDAIDARGLFLFQRAAIQNAARLVADALRVRAASSTVSSR